jgi:hypothetical protein
VHSLTQADIWGALVNNVLKNPFIWGMALTYFFIYVVRQVSISSVGGGQQLTVWVQMVIMIETLVQIQFTFTACMTVLQPCGVIHTEHEEWLTSNKGLYTRRAAKEESVLLG